MEYYLFTLVFHDSLWLFWLQELSAYVSVLSNIITNQNQDCDLLSFCCQLEQIFCDLGDIIIIPFDQRSVTNNVLLLCINAVWLCR